ncbi:MAG: single-stranded DNA-binding protein [Candidatus Pedobacter colombiensis]|uniref:Single-stranded DNA-binding protein n=1 Tax=Candidatus Pedobacter colombiensis TaxID=3121371 RepID=A0AAJ5WAT3_9SPHI|nr:single-stranded DNA-binding protein [Pedobacter sp.]WEK19994.1 MAG: single-stranded DNA-binding protein [Pedobacter sp.]
MEKVKNSVRLTGFAGADPVVINFANEKRMARLSIAVNEVYKNSSGEAINQTQWFSLIFWNKKVELVEKIVKKGTRFSIEGKLNTQSHIVKGGEQRYTTEVIVNTIELEVKETKEKENKQKENKEESDLFLIQPDR